MPMPTTKSPYFCVLPWYSSELNGPQNIPCCWMAKNYNLETVKKDLLEGVRTSACKECWNLEDRAEDSRRLQENRFLDYKLNRDIELIEQDCWEGKNKTLMYQIMLSNLCNQACVTCNARASTKWGQLISQQTKRPVVVRESPLLDINYSDAKRLYILGGEPLFDPRSLEILENLIRHNNTDCFISFVTNGSVTLSADLEEMLTNFADLNICVSVDGIESRFEYMRWPGNWATLTKNIDQYRRISRGNISVSYTISSVNAIYYDETVDWFRQQNLQYTHNIVTDPNWASLINMPVELKNYLKDYPFFKAWTEINGNEISLETLAAELEKQDRMKKISLNNYMPELWRVLKNVTI